MEIESTEETSTEDLERYEGEEERPEPLVVSDEEPKEEEKETAEPEAPAYTPNFSYRVKKEEKEIPERFRALVTDEASEREVRELFEKADGLETVKGHRDQLSAENENFKKEWVPYIQKTEAALDAARKGDLRGFFEKVGLSDDAIFQYTKKALELRKDPAAFEAQERARVESYRNQELEQSYQTLQSQNQQMAAAQREMELKFTLDRPDIRSTVSAYDERLGAPGSFRSEVVRIAQGYAAQGQDLPVETVVNHVAQQFVKMSGWTPHAKPAAPAPATTPVIPGSGRSQTKTLPNITGKGTSPAKRVLKSLDEIRAYGKELEAQENK